MYHRARLRVCWRLAIIALFAARPCFGENPAAHAGRSVGYNRDIRPILANSCFTCHGTDAAARKADLRLDRRESAVREVIVPGKAAESPLIERVTSTDPDEQMPPPGSKKPRLTPEAVEKLRRWIDEGAKYEMHWAYVPPARPALPDVPPKVSRRLVPQRDRPFHRRRPCATWSAPFARRRSPHAAPPPAVGPHRLAAVARRERRLRRGPLAGRLRAGGRSPAGVAAIRRADGRLLAGRGPLCRHRRLP